MKCTNCGGSVVLFQDLNSKHGLAQKFHWICTKCNTDHSSFHNSPKNNSGLDEINFRFFNALRSVGLGRSAAKIFCIMMGWQPPLTKCKKIKDALKCKLQDLAKKSIVKAASAAPSTGWFGQTNTITAAFDGSWMKRGFHSLR